MKAKYPTIKAVRALLIALKPQIDDDYRAFAHDAEDKENSLPSMLVTIACDGKGGWSYQTGDNSFTGGAYSYPYWALVSLERRSNSTELARQAVSDLADEIAGSGEFED